MFSFIYLFCAIVLSFLASFSVVKLIQFRTDLEKPNTAALFALALSPFTFSAVAIVVMILFDRHSHQFHLYATYIGLLCLALFSVRTWSQITFNSKSESYSTTEKLLSSVLVLSLGAVLFNAISFPLTQNDSLEYMTVAREMFITRSIYTYPLLDSAASHSGFYGPWTHSPMYVVLIYFFDIMQGHAEFPGIASFVSFWFLCSALIFIYLLGCIHNRIAGFVACLSLMIAPLFFLGVDASLIDALPVSGFAMMLCSILLFSINKRNAFVAGILLGFGVWTHSEAVLFLPLFVAGVIIFYGLKRWRNWLVFSGIALIVAILVAAWPYLRNLQIYQSMVEIDVEGVFTIPELGWKDYFRTGRGIDYLTAKIQYGVFKGWFSLKEYSFTYWLMLIGVFVFFTHTKVISIFRHLFVEKSLKFQERVVLLYIGLVLCYLVGVILSIALDMDMMIRNERYQLAISPAVVLVVGWGMSSLLSSRPSKGFFSRRCVLIMLLLFSVLHSSAFIAYRLIKNNFLIADFITSFPSRERVHPELSIGDYLNQHTLDTSIVLSLRPADMYYVKRRMISYLDPRLISFYREKDKNVAVSILKDLGISYVYLTDYALPSFYNSILQEILMDKDLATLEFDMKGYQVYALKPSKQQVTETYNMINDEAAWTKKCQLVIGGRKAIKYVDLYLSEEKIDLTKISQPCLDTPLFHRDYITLLLSKGMEVTPGQEYGLNVGLEGDGYIQFWLVYYDKHGEINKRILYGDTLLSDSRPRQTFNRRFKVPADAAFIRLGVEHKGYSRIRIKEVELSLIQ